MQDFLTKVLNKNNYKNKKDLGDGNKCIGNLNQLRSMGNNGIKENNKFGKIKEYTNKIISRIVSITKRNTNEYEDKGKLEQDKTKKKRKIGEIDENELENNEIFEKAIKLERTKNRMELIKGVRLVKENLNQVQYIELGK